MAGGVDRHAGSKGQHAPLAQLSRLTAVVVLLLVAGRRALGGHALQPPAAGGEGEAGDEVRAWSVSGLEQASAGSLRRHPTPIDSSTGRSLLHPSPSLPLT